MSVVNISYLITLYKITAQRCRRGRRRPVPCLARLLFGGIPRQAVYRVPRPRHLQLLRHGDVVLAGDHSRRGDVPQAAAADAQSRPHVPGEPMRRMYPPTGHRGPETLHLQQRTGPQELGHRSAGTATATPQSARLRVQAAARPGKISQLQTRTL